MTHHLHPILVPTELIPLISFDPRPTMQILPTMGNFPNEPVSPFAITPPSFPKPTVIPFPRWEVILQISPS